MRPTICYSFHRQRGMTYTGVLMILAVSIFIGLFAIKVGPHYLEHMTVTSIMEDLEQNPDVLKQSRSKIYKHINQAYSMNNLWDFKAEDTVTLKRNANNAYAVTVSYERRANLFRNIDVVTSFNSDEEGT